MDVDAHGNVWVADGENSRVQEFDKDGKFLFKFGSFGSKPGQFNNPRQVAVDKNVKFLYVVDSKNNRIQKFYTNGTFVKSWGTLGSGDGQFTLPVSVILDSQGNVISDLNVVSTEFKNLIPTANSSSSSVQWERVMDNSQK